MNSSNTGRGPKRRNRPKAPGSRLAVYGKLYDPLLDIRLRRNEPFGVAVESILKALQRAKNKAIAAGELARHSLYSFGTGYNALRWLREHEVVGCAYARGRAWYSWKEPAAGSRAAKIMIALGVIPPAMPARQAAPSRLRRMAHVNLARFAPAARRDKGAEA